MPINITELVGGLDKPCIANQADVDTNDKFITPQSFQYTKWLPAGMQGVKENKGNCRNCGANSYANNKCQYCGTNN
jgi:hypothetical protein